jgi:hypothetical protein
MDFDLFENYQVLAPKGAFYQFLRNGQPRVFGRFDHNESEWKAGRRVGTLLGIPASGPELRDGGGPPRADMYGEDAIRWLSTYLQGWGKFRKRRKTMEKFQFTNSLHLTKLSSPPDIDFESIGSPKWWLQENLECFVAGGGLDWLAVGEAAEMRHLDSERDGRIFIRRENVLLAYSRGSASHAADWGRLAV